MPVIEKIKITDEGIATLKKYQKEHRSFVEEVKKTRSELKNTWNKTYKPVIETSQAGKAINSLKTQADSFKRGLKAKLNVDNSQISKLRQAKEQMQTFSKMIASATINVKDNTKNKINNIYNRLLKIGKKTISPAVKIKDNAMTKIRRIKSEVSYLAKTVARPAVVLKDNAVSKASQISQKLLGIVKKPYNAVINAIDKTASGIASAGKSLASIGKKLVVPVTAAIAVSTAGIGAAVKSGMDLENQQISIKHFIGATNKDYTSQQIDQAANSFTEALRTNANATPFETGEVIEAGTRAVSITQGNTKEAMNLVTLAEDMAAASGGTKSVSDAMEALADAKLGEMERLKEFGFKVSADDFKKKGFKGVSKDLGDFYGGAAQKLATSGSGLLSTITGKLKSGVADFGLKIVDQLKPVLTNVIGFIDKVMPYIDKFGTSFGTNLGKGIQYISSIMPTFISGFKQMMPTFQVIISGIQQMLPPIMAIGGTLINTIKDVVVQATPVISQIIATIAQVLPAVQPVFQTIITTIGNIVTTVLPPLSSAIQLIGNVIVAVAPVVSAGFSVIGEVITNAVGGIASIIQGALDLINAAWNGSWSGMVSAFKTIFGGIVKICKTPINGVISIINKAIEGINGIAIDLPDWIPVVGGKHFGMDLSPIPLLAKGGVVSQATMAVVGEAGKEAVMPLERNTGWIDNLAGQLVGKMTPNNLGAGTSQIPLINGNGVPAQNYTETKNTTIRVEKLADQIVVKDKEDIDDVASTVAEKIKEVIDNM
jgi:hypothetical protein